MKKIINKAALPALAFIFTVISTSVAASADKVGFINIQKLVSESDMGKKKSEEHALITEQKNKILREKLAELELLDKALHKELEKKVPDGKTIAEINEKIQQGNKDAKRFETDAKEELAKKDAQFVMEILVKSNPILKELGDREGYAVILKNIDDIAYLGQGVDITDQVIKKLNAGK